MLKHFKKEILFQLHNSDPYLKQAMFLTQLGILNEFVLFYIDFLTDKISITDSKFISYSRFYSLRNFSPISNTIGS
jgi:hypothetical protein